MNPIIEKVARAMEDCGSMSSYAKAGYLREARARAAIRATLEHLRDNVSEGMVDAAHSVIIDESEGDGYGNITELEISAKAVSATFAKALAELDA